LNKILILACLSTVAISFGNTPKANAQTYTSDPRISDFTSQVSMYGTFSNYTQGDITTPTFTPTSAELSSNGFRVFLGGTVTGLAGSNWILVSFSSPVSSILVFPNIDHLEEPYDGYQYSIIGSNDSWNWTPLFDAMSVGGPRPPYTLTGFTGTAPSIVNNVLTGGCTNGCVGYEARFDFGAPYLYYAFGGSTFASTRNFDQELSAVGSTATPEPGSMVLIGTGLWLIAWRRKLISKA
jgi:hypothetical protein